MANNTTCRSCDNPYYLRAQIIAKSAGNPTYRFGIDESVCLPGNQHGFVRDILDGGKIYVVQMFESTELALSRTSKLWHKCTLLIRANQ